MYSSQQPLTGDVPTDKKMIYEALAAGRCFIGYDLPPPRRGFIFKAKGREQSAIMGDEISAKARRDVTGAPASAGRDPPDQGWKDYQIWKNAQACAYSVSEAGCLSRGSLAELSGAQTRLDFQQSDLCEMKSLRINHIRRKERQTF